MASVAKILIIDDEEFVRSFLEDALTGPAYSIMTAADSEAAIQLLTEFEFDLVLSDINMPGISGLDLLSFLKSEYKTMEVILITGDPGYEDAVESIKHGAFDYLSKPIEPDKLIEKVEAALKTQEEKRDILACTSTEYYHHNYSVIQTLGSGSTGFVLLVEKNNQQYAMKVLKGVHDTPDQEMRIKRFMREAEILSKIDHPNIVKIMDFGISPQNQSPFIVMEFVEGDSLNNIIKTSQFSFLEKLSLIKQIASALHIIHEQDVIHRDVKPANILITSDNIAKLIDFGIAGLKDSDLTITDELLGSPAYMSPEAFNGVKQKDKRSDIFSLGVIAYELFTEAKPFNSDSIGGLINEIKNTKPIAPQQIDPNIPLDIQEILAKMLSKDIEERFQDSQQVLDALDQVVQNSKDKNDAQKKVISFPLKTSTWR